MSHAAPSPETIDRIKDILRTDLRLQHLPRIDDDAPLTGSDLDLDSLDILLLVSSIEKTFAIRIPNDEIDQDAFQSVATLSRFVEQRLSDAGHDA